MQVSQEHIQQVINSQAPSDRTVLPEMKDKVVWSHPSRKPVCKTTIRLSSGLLSFKLRKIKLQI